MTTGLRRPAEDRLRETRIALERRRDGHRVCRMEIDRYVECRDALPERQAARIVEIDALGVAVDQRALETELFHRALQLGGGLARILHRHRGETAEARGMLGDSLGQRIVDHLRLADRRRGIALALDSRLKERQHRDVDTGLVHGVETQRVDLRQSLGRLATERRRRPAALGAPHIGESLDEEMLLKRDHSSS